MSCKNTGRRCEKDVWCRQYIQKQNANILRRLQREGVTVISLSKKGAHITRKDRESGEQVESYIGFDEDE